MPEPCRVCARTYSPGATSLTFQGHGTDYYLTMRDQHQLLRAKNYSFHDKKRPIIMYRWRNDASHETQKAIGGDPPKFNKHRILQNNKHKRHQLRDLWVFEPTDVQSTGGTLRPTNPSTSEPEGSINQDIGWAPLSTRNFLTKPKHFIIRTMYDRDVNLADLTWVVSLAMLSENNVDAIFLHDDNFVWFNWRSIPQNDNGFGWFNWRSIPNVKNIFESLDKPSLFRPNLKQFLTFKNGAWVLRRTARNMRSMSKQMRPYGNIGVFKYPKMTEQYTFSNPQRAPCPACGNSVTAPKDALINDIDDDENHFYLTPADILTLQSIRNETFGPRADTNGKMTLPGKNVPLMGYFETNITSQSSKSEFSPQFKNPSNVKKVEGSMPRLLFRLLAHANFITTGRGDQYSERCQTDRQI